MTEALSKFAPAAVSSLSAVALASVLDQSIDCVKLVTMDGCIDYMNGNGMCAMEIDDFCAIEGQPWASLWPAEARPSIEQSLLSADAGGTARFRAFCPTAKGNPRWWDVSVSAVTNPAGDQVGYLSVSRDVTDAEIAREALEVAASELKHRLANTYAVISGMLMGFARGNADNEQFASEMRDRLSALGQAQALFVNKEAPCAIEKLVPSLLAPFEQPHCPIDTGSLCPSWVNQGQADAIALTIGELAINSSKHGAIAHGGEIRVSAVDAGEGPTIDWVERSDRPAQATSREGGQGLKLMERIVRARQGTIDFAWTDSGLAVRLTFRRR